MNLTERRGGKRNSAEERKEGKDKSTGGRIKGDVNKLSLQTANCCESCGEPQINRDSR